jgi:protein phosphatase
MGLISAGEAGAARTSHVLSRSLGGNLFLNVETSEHQIFSGDMLMQCSDGLHHSLRPEDIARLTHGDVPLSQAAKDLIDLANERDGSDNISVQLVRVKAVERVGMYRGRHYKLH